MECKGTVKQLDEIYVGALTGNIANFTFEFINIGTKKA